MNCQGQTYRSPGVPRCAIASESLDRRCEAAHSGSAGSHQRGSGEYHVRTGPSPFRVESGGVRCGASRARNFRVYIRTAPEYDRSRAADASLTADYSRTGATSVRTDATYLRIEATYVRVGVTNAHVETAYSRFEVAYACIRATYGRVEGA